MSSVRIDVDKPLYDVSTFFGRFRHFMWMCDPRTVTVSSRRLLEAKQLLQLYREGREPPGTTPEQIKYAMKLVAAAFHPDTGELQNVMGRMSFQLPGNMILTGGMLSSYRSTAGVVFWQFVNQSFNAIVNFTNRNANSPTSYTQLGIAYVCATVTALGTALGCKAFFEKRASPLVQRFVPFLGVAAANCVNLPLMRQNEIINGIDVNDEKGNRAGRSRVAAVKGITQVVFSRIVMAAPGMLLLPVIMERLETVPLYKRYKKFDAAVQIVFVGVFIFFMTPVGCALFPQNCSLKTSTMRLLEPGMYAEMEKNTKGKIPERVYFNKGL